ncbi:MAG TPA: sugar phosphate isomerase/epimerase family protein [Chloroflexota bacterium]|nr:sugar phosphate isomerase/epimerase family protein [Chloroflexota bacterium]
MRIGYNTWSMATVPYQVFIPRLAEIGYTAIAVSVVPGYTIGGQRVPNATDLSTLTAEDRRRIKEGCEQRGLELPSVIGNQPVIEDDAEKSRASLQRLRETIDFCVEVTPQGQGVPTLNTGSGGRPQDFESKRQQLVDRLGELADYAGRRGVIVCLEPHVGAAIDTPARSEWLVHAVNHPHLRLDFDISHFEVVGIPAEETVPRLAPLASSVEIKDQHFRYLDEPAPEGWLIEGNGVGRAVAPNGRDVEFQFLLGGEGDFDLPKYLRLMQQAGWKGAIGFEASVQCQARPGYDALASAQSTYRWMADGWARASISKQ